MPTSAVAAAVIAALLGGVGCSSSGSSGKAAATPAASVPFPLAVGNMWKYKVTESPVSWTETDKVTSVVPVTGGQKITMIQTITGVAKPFSDRLVYFFHSDGTITCSQLGPHNESTAGDVLPRFPPAAIVDSGGLVKVDVPVTLQGRQGPYRATTHITLQGKGTATVTVPTGTYRAIIVSESATQTVLGRSFYYKTWLVPGVGPVQQQQTIAASAGLHSSAIEELESFSKG